MRCLALFLIIISTPLVAYNLVMGRWYLAIALLAGVIFLSYVLSKTRH